MNEGAARADAWARMLDALKTRRGLLLALILVLTVAGPCTGAAAASHSGAGRWLYTVLASIFGLGIAAASAAREKASEGERQDLRKQLADAQVKARVKIGVYLERIARELADLCVLTDERDKFHKVTLLTSAVLEAGSALSSGAQARCTWFCLNENDELVVEASNTTDTPGTQRVFHPTSDAYRAIYALAARKGFQFFRDLKVDQPPGFHAPKRAYETYIGVPVIAGGSWLGWLTVDSGAPGDLNDEVDVPIMRVMAFILATAHIISGSTKVTNVGGTPPAQTRQPSKNPPT